jgi:hypothetical protein
MAKNPPRNYYHIDAGHFPAHIKLCFSDKDFQKILSDHNIYGTKTNALEMGTGETHYFSDGKYGIIILALDLDECEDDDILLAGLIAHEATHCVCRVFEHIGEELDEIGEESRAYLTEHIVRQLTGAVKMEKEKNARKRDRKILDKTGEGTEGNVPEVDLNHNGSPGSTGVSEPKVSASRTKNGQWQIVSTSTTGISATGRSGISCDRGAK